MAAEHSTAPEPEIRHEDLRRVLERAIQLDAGRPTTIRLSELQRIGEEIGVSAESIARAASELAVSQTNRVASSESWKQRLRAWANSVGIGTIAFFAGMVVGRKVEVLSFWLFVGIAAAAFYYRRKGKNKDYVRDMAALAAGFGAGWFIASGMINEGDTSFHLIMPGVFGIAAGWTLIRIQRPLRRLLKKEVVAAAPSGPINPDVK